jgi:hypothetical protein
MLEEIEDELMRSPVGEDMESILIEKRGSWLSVTLMECVLQDAGGD